MRASASRVAWILLGGNTLALSIIDTKGKLVGPNFGVSIDSTNSCGLVLAIQSGNLIKGNKT
jgi:hypothetical protein